MSDAQQKQLKDYSAEVEQQLPVLLKPLDGGKNASALLAVLADLLALEKKTRLAADAKSTQTVAAAILQACWDAKDWKALNEHISVLTKRRAQLQKVVESVIQHGARLATELDVSTAAGEQIQRELIETLRTVSSGKMFVELERAQLTQILANMEEKHGRVKEAAELLQEIQVETIGSMQAEKKVDYLLEQIRLVLRKKDYVRVEIIAKKIQVKQFSEAEHKDDPVWQGLKLKYYNLMIEYHQHFAHYLESAKSFREIFHTPLVQADEAQWKPALAKLVIYGILSPWDAELSDMLHRIAAEKKLEQLPQIKRVLDDFIGNEIMQWPLASAADLKRDSTFSADAHSADAMSDDAAPSASAAAALSDELDVSETEAERKDAASSGAQRWNDFHKRIVQHNIRVVGGYYARLRSERLGELLRLEPAKTEVLLSEMVSTKQLWARIDRPRGIITFKAPQPATEVLNSYAADLSSLLAVVERTCHMIAKESMVHGIAAK